MARKQRSFFISVTILLVTFACRVSGNPVPTLAAYPTQPVTNLPLITLSTPTTIAGDELHAIFPSFSLTGSDTVCLDHFSHALSCLDATGWHNYENEYDETSNPHSTIPRMMFACPDGRIYLVDDVIYQVEGEVLVDIGGYVDQGIIACGRGSEIWVSDMNGISHFDGSAWVSYPVDTYFLGSTAEGSEYIHAMAVAPNGNVWVTTSSTIAAFDGSNWNVFTPPGEPAYHDSMGDDHGLVVDTSGTVWAIAYPDVCCTDNQLLKYDGVQWTSFPGPENEYHEMNFIAADHENRIWTAIGRNKIYILDPKTNEWEFRFDVQQLGLGKGGEYSIAGMEFDRQGRLWIVTDYGVGIYDGTAWTTYHLHTANLYMNDIADLFIFGDGPLLPAQEVKAPGSVSGKLVSRNVSPFTDTQVEVCLKPGDLYFSGETPCADQTFHVLADVNKDGSFLIPNIPTGMYYLMIKLSFFGWGAVVNDDQSFFVDDNFGFFVKPGTETQLGEISTP